MAIPSRFLKPAANRAAKKRRQKTGAGKSPNPNQKPGKKPDGQSTGKALSSLNSTVIGVGLSVLAHGLILAFGPRANFSFAALTEAAQQQEAEETIVPVVEISPTDLSRLPSFAQPRRTAPTGLGNYALPPGIPNTRSVPTPQQRVPARSNTTARRLPSTTTPNQTRRRQLPSTVRTIPLSPDRFNTRRTPSRTDTRTSSPTPVITNPSVTDPSELTDLNSSPSGITLGSNSGFGTQNGAPAPPGTREPSTGTSAEDLLTQRIEEQNNGRSDTALLTEPSNDPSSPSSIAEEQGEEIPVERPPIDLAAADAANNDPTRLLEGYVYDERQTTEDEAQANFDGWVEETTEAEVPLASLGRAETNIEIDSNFKACTENPPNPGLIGVVVNPDGSPQETRVLRSVGYDVLNRQAMSVVERQDFEPSETPTLYEITVDVAYDAEGCIKSLPSVD
ncbi:MAG: TonB family protein [Cyanobacteria bacterium P01_D01_bin.36]